MSAIERTTKFIYFQSQHQNNSMKKWQTNDSWKLYICTWPASQILQRIAMEWILHTHVRSIHSWRYSYEDNIFTSRAPGDRCHDKQEVMSERQHTAWGDQHTRAADGNWKFIPRKCMKQRQSIPFGAIRTHLVIFIPLCGSSAEEATLWHFYPNCIFQVRTCLCWAPSSTIIKSSVNKVPLFPSRYLRSPWARGR